ncbi:Eco57I restriction-modification methylase domain-containing protein [Halovivax limisalsi]|uniref:Eco57I restriction-modification methylase domain-containing protein n=1 Tax=Halovivax limisalsi TaxID=1453760 RepID=UPI001FFD6EA3|nr:Eco57I restriction-modification methylase domain-containing protein [Halovivax limisalsi]
MQRDRDFRRTRRPFSSGHLEGPFRESPAWTDLDDASQRAAVDAVREIWERERATAADRSARELEATFVRPILRALERHLGEPVDGRGDDGVDPGGTSEGGPDRTAATEWTDDSSASASTVRRFAPTRTVRTSEGDDDRGGEYAHTAGDGSDGGKESIGDAVALLDVRVWDRPLDAVGESAPNSDESSATDAGVPSYQVHAALQAAPVRWAICTNGRTWRLYDASSSHRLDAPYEIDLPALLRSGTLEDWRYFTQLFGPTAVEPDDEGRCLLDTVAAESETYLESMEADLQRNARRAVEALANGFRRGREDAHSRSPTARADAPDPTGGPAPDDRLLQASIRVLVRLLVLGTASRREIVSVETGPTDRSDAHVLDRLRRVAVDNGGDDDGRHHRSSGACWDRLTTLFDSLADATGRSVDDRAAPGARSDDGRDGVGSRRREDRVEQFLANAHLGDATLGRVLDLLSYRDGNADGDARRFAYDDLDGRSLGRQYEALLEFELAVATEPLRRSDGEWVPQADAEGPAGATDERQQPSGGSSDSDANVPTDAAGDASERTGEPAVVEAGAMYLRRESDERAVTGSFYTPQWVVDGVVDDALGQLVEAIRTGDRGGAASTRGRDDGIPFLDRLRERRVLDPAMGTGHFLLGALDRVTLAAVRAADRAATADDASPLDRSPDVDRMRRIVAANCLYGVDTDPVAVELARASLWLRAGPERDELRAGTDDDALTRLGEHLRTGNALLGCAGDPIEAIASEATEGDDEVADGRTPNRSDRLRTVLDARTAVACGFEDVPADAPERLANALSSDDAWERACDAEWVDDVDRLASEHAFFHWHLAFPAVFARREPPAERGIEGTGGPANRRDDEGGARFERDGGETGTRSDAATGFDAVVGNPPWVITGEEPVRASVESTYRYQSGQPDLYRCFVERSVDLARETVSLVTPQSWLSMPAASELRRATVGTGMLRRVSLLPRSTFPAVGANATTFVLDVAGGHERIEVFERRPDGAPIRIRDVAVESIAAENYRLELRASERERALVSRLEADATPLGDLVDRTVGYQLYHADLHDPDVIEAEAHHASEAVSDGHVPEIRASSLSPYHVDPTPDGYVDREAEFFRLPPARFRDGDRVLVREVTGDDGITAARVRREALVPKSIITIVPTDDRLDAGTLTALLNSRLLSFVHLVSGEKGSQQLFPRLSLSSLDRLPIRLPPADPDWTDLIDETVTGAEAEVGNEAVAGSEAEVGDETDAQAIRTAYDRAADGAAFCSWLADDISRLSERRAALETDLDAYLDSYRWGPSLGDLPGCDPIPGAAESVLAETTATRRKLRLAAAVEIREDDGAIVIAVRARYKPAGASERDADDPTSETDDQTFETDTHGYVTTDAIPAFRIDGPGPEVRPVLSAFVPYAVSRADGFADVRTNATKTISLLDRLAALRLPKPDDIADDLARYAATVERARALDEAIEARRELVDELVFELYDCTEAERRLVRERL